MRATQQGIAKGILLAAVALLTILVIAVIGYMKPSEPDNMSTSPNTKTASNPSHHENGSHANNSHTKPTTANIPQKQLTKDERVDVMTQVLAAAKKDIAHAKAQLADAKKQGNVQAAADAQARLDRMREVLKAAKEKHADLGLTYPKELFEDSNHSTD